MMLRNVLAAVPLLTGLALASPASALPVSSFAVAAHTPLTDVRLVCHHGQCYRSARVRRYSSRRVYRSYARPRYEERRYYSEEMSPRLRGYSEQAEFRDYRSGGPRFGYEERRYDRSDVGVRFRREREDDED